MDVRACNTKFCLIINTVKIGTSYVRTLKRLENYTGEPDGTFNIKLLTNTNSTRWWVGAQKANVEDMNYNALDSFLNGTIKKDVIILIRDPYERFISAFNQDFIKPIFNDVYNLHIIGQSILERNENQSLYDWWKSSNLSYLQRNPITTQDTNNISYDDLDKTFKLCIESIIKSIANSWVESKCDTNYNHNILYHPIIVNMVFKNKNKFKIFDIDDVDMNDIFSKYLVGKRNIGNLNQANFTKRIISDIFSENMLNKYVKDELKLEQMAYGSLKQLAQLKNN